MRTPTADATPAEVAHYLRAANAKLIIEAVRLVASVPLWKYGKVALGKEAGAHGDLGRCARVVERAERMGLISQIPTRPGTAFHYQITDRGRDVLAEF